MLVQSIDLIVAEWDAIFEVVSGGRENPGYCIEYLNFSGQDEGIEGRAVVSFRFVDGAMSLVLLGEPERIIELLEGEADLLLDALIAMSDYGIVSTGHAGGTRTDFDLCVNRHGQVFIVPPGEVRGAEVQPVADALLFLSERMLNLVEAL